MSDPLQIEGDLPRIIDEQDWIEKMKWPVLGGIILVLAILAGIGIWWNHSNSQRQQAAEMLFSEQPDGLAELVEGFAGTPAGAVGLIRSGERAANEENWEAAIIFYDQFLNLHKRHPMVSAVEIARANAFEAGGNDDAAANAYQEILRAVPTHPFAAAARLGMARIYISRGDTRAARQSLTELLALETSDTYMADAQRLLRSLPPEN